ncbi:Helix-turn-helix [Pseudomonas sp. LAMO17WK12:I10]|uniref:helix-turn-helix domain-containing protein n=1 Tax=unclassified Pseudomonas TaxID=196821 RepID=UPI000BDBD102|nr:MULTISPECIES: helix-turn-helix transcriptional regulator [unclassified Pseudomonas]PXX58239.1 helix-turn-helix protein [Pseudomonas sp. LAMO17WK12:I9]SNY47726.1 Helix-turn-helix [Pseudomonas sp. LAMO17WK12:I10]
MELKYAFGQALRELRMSKDLSQESIGASQSYVSDVERGLKTPSIEKLDEFASTIGIHPVTILAKSYLVKDRSLSPEDLMALVRKELGMGDV